MGWQVSVLVSLKDRNSLGICISKQTVQQLRTGQAQQKQVPVQAIALHSVDARQIYGDKLKGERADT